jgi:hypothetical protein
MEYTLTEKEKSFLEVAKRVIEEWRDIMDLDPIWDISTEIIEDEDEGAKGAINIGKTQYYKASILLCENLFDLEEEEFLAKLSDNVVPHELTHLVAADFFRTALLAAGENEHLRSELRYKYEQFTIRFARIIAKLRNENLRLRYELESPDPGTKE